MSIVSAVEQPATNTVSLNRICIEYGKHKQTIRRYVTVMGAPHVVVRNRFRFEPDKFKQWHANELPKLKPVFVQTGVREIYRGGGTIYRIVDPKRNEPCYIGATVNAENRFFDHITDLRKQRHGNLKLQRIYNKRLREGFGELKIETHETVLLDLGERERYWIALYRKKTNGRLCNISDGGNAGCTSDESKKKLAEKTRAIWRNPEYAKKCRLGWDAAMAKKLGVSLEQYLSNRVVYRKDAPKPENVALYHERRAMAARRRAEENELKKQMATLTYVTHNGVAFVPCTNGKWARIDAEDVGKVIKHKWNANHKGGGRYAAKTTISKKKPTLAMIINGHMSGAGWVEYKDGNSLNCCKSNLCFMSPEMRRKSYNKESLLMTLAGLHRKIAHDPANHQLIRVARGITMAMSQC